MFTLICARINGWVNNREAGDLRRYRAHYDVIVKWCILSVMENKIRDAIVEVIKNAKKMNEAKMDGLVQDCINSSALAHLNDVELM